MKDLTKAIELIEEVLSYTDFCPVWEAFANLEQARVVLREAMKGDAS